MKYLWLQLSIKNATPEKQPSCHHLLSPALTPVIPSTNHFILLKYDFFTIEIQCRSKTKQNMCCCSENLQGIAQGNSKAREKLISQFAVYSKAIEKSYTTVTNLALSTTDLTFWKVTSENMSLKRVKKKKLRNWNHSCVATFCTTWCPQSPQLQRNFTAKTNKKSKTNSRRLQQKCLS